MDTYQRVQASMRLTFAHLLVSILHQALRPCQLKNIGEPKCTAVMIEYPELANLASLPRRRHTFVLAVLLASAPQRQEHLLFALSISLGCIMSTKRRTYCFPAVLTRALSWPLSDPSCGRELNTL